MRYSHEGLNRAAASALAFVVLHPSVSAAFPIVCGDIDRDGYVSVSDAFVALRAAVGLDACEPCLCDVDDDLEIRTRDALVLLRASVGVASPTCRACEHDSCGDGEVQPYDGSVLTGTVIVVRCEELDSGGPGAPPPFDATLVKAFDRNIQRVDDSVNVTVENAGCFCQQVLTSGSAAQREAFTSTTASLDCSDCFFNITVETTAEVAALEIYTDFRQCSPVEEVSGMRTLIDDRGGPSTIRVDGGVTEECDDGNRTYNDGCAGNCVLEQPWHCHFDASSHSCGGFCDSSLPCVLRQDGGCACAFSVCSQCWSTLGYGCSGQCFNDSQCPPNSFCGGTQYGDCPNIECPCCPECGDGHCTLDESRCNCAVDCGAPLDGECTSAICGDTFCAPEFTSESYETCPQDCSLACREC